jgi:hypothetical protein
MNPNFKTFNKILKPLIMGRLNEEQIFKWKRMSCPHTIHGDVFMGVGSL